MEQNVQFIEGVHKEFFKQEKLFDDLKALNGYINNKKDFILYVNIRSLNANFTKLQVFVESLMIKPSVIVCTETRVLEHYQYFSLDGYKIYYNDSKINNSDGVVIYLKDHIIESTSVVKVGRLSVLNSTIRIDDKNNLDISAVYRSHDLPKTEFIEDLNNYLDSKKKLKNHLLIGDFNIDLLKLDNVSQEFLNILLEMEFSPGFQGITRPSVNNDNVGSCIDNIFIKTTSIETKSFKLTNLFNDHFPLFLSINKINYTSFKKKFYFNRLYKIIKNCRKY